MSSFTLLKSYKIALKILCRKFVTRKIIEHAIGWAVNKIAHRPPTPLAQWHAQTEFMYGLVPIQADFVTAHATV